MEKLVRDSSLLKNHFRTCLSRLVWIGPSHRLGFWLWISHDCFREIVSWQRRGGLNTIDQRITSFFFRQSDNKFTVRRTWLQMIPSIGPIGNLADGILIFRFKGSPSIAKGKGFWSVLLNSQVVYFLLTHRGFGRRLENGLHALLRWRFNHELTGLSSLSTHGTCSSTLFVKCGEIIFKLVGPLNVGVTVALY